VNAIRHNRADTTFASGSTGAHKAVLAVAPKPFAGFLIAEGDSWFNFPLFDEIIERLEDDHNYRIESAARFGDTADNSLYNEGSDGNKLVKVFEKLQSDGRIPRAILLSCGGNDIACDQLRLLLRYAKSPSPGLDLPVVDPLFARLEETIRRGPSWPGRLVAWPRFSRHQESVDLCDASSRGAWSAMSSTSWKEDWRRYGSRRTFRPVPDSRCRTPLPAP
jgi:hypothetical protein